VKIAAHSAVGTPALASGMAALLDLDITRQQFNILIKTDQENTKCDLSWGSETW
jgi:hypothetical protein